MAEIINFFNQQQLYKTRNDNVDVVSFLPRLKYLSGETIILTVDDRIVKEDNCLESFAREVLLMKYVGINVVVVFDIRNELNKYFYDVFGVQDKLDNDIEVNIGNEYDVVEVLIRHNGLNIIRDVFSRFGADVLSVSGYTLGISLVSLKDEENFPFGRAKRELNNFSLKHNGTRQNSVGLLDEIFKTDIIPVVSPIFMDKCGNVVVMEGKHFAGQVAGLLGALKCVFTYIDEKQMPDAGAYGVERIERISNDGTYGKNVLNMVDASVCAINGGTQGVHIIDVKQTNLIEEICSSNFAGLFVYDDSINHL